MNKQIFEQYYPFRRHRYNRLNPVERSLFAFPKPERGFLKRANPSLANYSDKLSSS